MAKKMKKKEKKGMDKHAFWFFLILILALTLIILTPFVYHEVFNKFEYAGIAFEKNSAKGLTFYHGVFPIIVQGKLYHHYNMYLRNDPRENNIPINAALSLSRNVSISYEEKAFTCKSAILGQSLVGQFFYAFPWVKKVDTGLINPELAKAENFSYITCANASLDHTVFIVQSSNNLSIEQGETDNCFIINAGNCQNLEAMERLVVGSIAQINEIKI